MENNKLPNANIVLILGILSVITCICYGIFGILFGVIALVLAQKDMKLDRSNDIVYTNYQTVNIGRVLAIIGIVLGVLFIIMMIWVISIVGMDALGDENLMRERLQEYFQS
jgi:predicted membrane protein